MLHSFGDRLFLGVCLILSCLLLSQLGSVYALPASASGSITISAVVAPVRIIDVDSSGKVVEIISNSPSPVGPTVIRNLVYSKPIPLTKSIQSQYSAVTARINVHDTGIIYARPSAARLRTSDITELKHPVSYQSILYLVTPNSLPSNLSRYSHS
jgi:hypothetical protein